MKKNIFYTLCHLLLVGNLYSQQTVWVKATASGTGDGSSEANAFGSFTNAFAQINSATDVLRVVGIVPASGQSLNKNFAYTIQGDAGGSTLTGTAGATRMFTNNTASTASQNVTFRNIKFTGATGSTGTGGGVLFSNQANTINFENCRFEGNSLVSTVTTGGGALFITATTVTITDCLFKENTALSKGGAISIATGANVTLTRCTFYKNKTTSTTGNLNAAALHVVTGAVVNAYNCTFFQNTTGTTNQDYGVIRTDGGTTKVYNSLFYDNKLNTDAAAAGDWGSVASIGSTLTNSLAQKINANVTNTSSTVSPTIALGSSNLTYDDTSGKVKYGLPTPGDASPIDFGSDGNDVGAWDSGLTLLNTWTGATSTDWTVASNWNIGVPDATKGAVIGTGTFQPIIGSTVSIASLTLNASTSLTVNSGYNLTVTGAIANNGGTLTLENNANLIQGGTTNTNTGNVIVKRNSASIQLYDYTLWSSPVAGQNLKDFSTQTLDSRFYTYDSTLGTNGLYSVISSPAATPFAPATGYLIRMPNNHPTTPTVWNGAFTGVPNNGDVPFTMVDGGVGKRFNLVGNPYPSPITISTFVSDNTANITGTLYFWRKTNGSGTAYCTYAGSTFVTNNNAQSANPNGVIQTGQGFFVEGTGVGTALAFKNTQRVANTANQFFRTNVIENNRIWLNLTNATGIFSQMAVGYITDATQGVDSLDGKYINDAPVALTSIINAEEYTIQGRALPFATTDTVPLGFKTNAAGNYTISIDHVDGLFSTGQTVFLKDNLLNTVVDLSAGSYSFASAIGTFNSRFEVLFQGALGVNNPAFIASSVIAFGENGEIKINSGSTIMKLVRVYDLQGRLLVEKKQINASETKLSTTATNQVLLVEITADNGSKITKKIIQ